MARMSAAVPMTSPDGSCSISMAFSGMTISSPAIAIMLAIEAAMPSIQTVIAASFRITPRRQENGPLDQRPGRQHHHFSRATIDIAVLIALSRRFALSGV